MAKRKRRASASDLREVRAGKGSSRDRAEAADLNRRRTRRGFRKRRR